MPRSKKPKAPNATLASLLCIAAASTWIAGCGSTSPTSSVPPPTTGAGTPTVTVSATATSITTLQSLTVNIAVSGPSTSTTPSGSVILSSGNYASFPANLTNGQAVITVPAGVLAAGSDTLTAAYLIQHPDLHQYLGDHACPSHHDQHHTRRHSDLHHLSHSRRPVPCPARSRR